MYICSTLRFSSSIRLGRICLCIGWVIAIDKGIMLSLAELLKAGMKLSLHPPKITGFNKGQVYFIWLVERTDILMGFCFCLIYTLNRDDRATSCICRQAEWPFLSKKRRASIRRGHRSVCYSLFELCLLESLQKFLWHTIFGLWMQDKS